MLFVKNKVETNLEYRIYSVEGYSLNPKMVERKLYLKKRLRQMSVLILIIDALILIKIIVSWIIKKRQSKIFQKVKITENSYISDNNLFK